MPSALECFIWWDVIPDREARHVAKPRLSPHRHEAFGSIIINPCHRPTLSDHQDGNRTTDEDLRGLAAEQKSAKPASAVGSHDDKIAMSRVGGCDDRLGGLSLGDMNSFGVDAKPTLLVLNQIDRVTDPSILDVLRARHPKSVAVSAKTGQGLGELRDAVMEMLSADFANAEIIASAANGRVLSYLAAHAEIYRQTYDDDQVVVRCWIPRHLMHHVHGDGVAVRELGNSITT